MAEVHPQHGGIVAMTLRRTIIRLLSTLLTTVALALPDGVHGETKLRAVPDSIVLDRPEASQQILVSRRDTDGRTIDVTRRASYRLRPAGIAAIDALGLIVPVADGDAILTIDETGRILDVPVMVRGLKGCRPLDFDTEIVPILTKARCNSGTCHGKAEGQHGFKLGVFGFDPSADYDAIVKESAQRRIVRGSPQRSLLVLKAAALVPHGGGRRIEPNSLFHRTLSRWIREGAPRVENSASVRSIEVEPREQIVRSGESQQIQVTAIDGAGRRFCVTRTAEYESNADFVAQVDATGLAMAADSPGEAAILVRYMGHVAICRITQPRVGTHFSRPPEANTIDRLVWDRLERLGIQPSELCDDATFLRRAYLDVIGRLPTPAEAREFLTGLKNSARDSAERHSGKLDFGEISRAAADSTVVARFQAIKRGQLVEQLLDRPEYADYWALRWADVLRVDRDKMTGPGAVAVTRWLRREFAENRPYDEIVRAILTARGDTSAEGPAAIYRVLATPEDLSRSVSQLFLGVRIECAQCHHHPFEKWGQDDYYGLAGFFTGITTKNLSSGNPAILLTAGTDLKNPRRDAAVPTHALGASAARFDGIEDRRRVLADWITAADNPYFSRAIANRLWAHFFGRGLVEPIDDLRATNPPANEPLLDELARQLAASHYDLKSLLRLMLNSRAYQLSGKPNDSNLHDEQNFSHARPKALEAEVLLDAISDATGAPEKFQGWPASLRAVELWDNDVESYFLKIFGRPVRATVCECERSNEPSIAQALHLLNSQEIAAKIESSGGRARRLSDGRLSPAQVVEELYLATLSRFPTVAERNRCAGEFVQADRRRAAEDLLWALLNSKQFLYAW
jgi:hypothetical protein